MAKQTINIGTGPNTGTGEGLRSAFTKINDNFTEVYDIAQNAYNYANTIVSDTQIDPLARSTANSAYNQANSAATLAQASYDYANTIVSDTQVDPLARSTANSAFDGANSASQLAQAAYNYANTIVSDTQVDPLARSTANSASQLAQSAYDYANTIVSDTQVDPLARSTANAAYDAANSSSTLAQAAYDYANTIVSDTQVDPLARSTANSAWSTANAAFNQANTGGNPFDQDLNTSNNVTFNEITSNNVYFDNLNLTGNVFSSSACSAINFIANSSGDGAGAATIELIPDTNLTGTDQYLIIDPTAPGHIHIRAGGTQDSSSAELFLGGEESHIKIGAGFNPPVTINANTYSWNFDVNGELTVPGKIYFDNGIESALTLDQFGIRANTQLSLSAENYATGNNSTILFDKNGSGITFRLEDTTPVSKNWNFYQNSLVFPDSSTQTTAFTLTPTLNSLTVNGKSTLDKVVEPFSDIADATGVVTHDCTNNHIFYHTSLDANFTANFTNLSLANNEATSLTLVLSQGGTAYIANNVQIGGVAQTIKWSANTVPTGNTNAVDVQSFSILRVSGNYIVLGQLSTFG